MTLELQHIINNQVIGYILKSPKNKHLLDELINITSFLDENVTVGQRVWHIKNGVYEMQLCECGKPMKYNKGAYTMCYKCGQSKNKLTLQNKSQEEWKEIINKQITTNLKRYGVNNPAKNKEILEKIKQTNLRKYNATRATTLQHFKDKLPKDGGYRNEKILEKIKQTNLRKYGNELYHESTPYYEFVGKIAKERLEKYNVEYVSYLRNKLHLLKCKECGREFIFSTDNRYRIISSIILCSHCYKPDLSTSMLEKQLFHYISSIYNGMIKKNDKSVLKIKKKNNRIVSYELDIFLPELNIAFEFNGTGIHCDPRFYKKNDKGKFGNLARDIWKKDALKRKLCEERNIRLITIWEMDWINRRKIVERYINYII